MSSATADSALVPSPRTPAPMATLRCGSASCGACSRPATCTWTTIWAPSASGSPTHYTDQCENYFCVVDLHAITRITAPHVAAELTKPLPSRLGSSWPPSSPNRYQVVISPPYSGHTAPPNKSSSYFDSYTYSSPPSRCTRLLSLAHSLPPSRSSHSGVRGVAAELQLKLLPSSSGKTGATLCSSTGFLYNLQRLTLRVPHASSFVKRSCSNKLNHKPCQPLRLRSAQDMPIM
jgi:hypothetical protein